MKYNETTLNSHWSLRKLNELGEFKRGKSKHRPRNDRRLFENGSIPLIQTGDIKAANLYINEASEFYNEFGLSQSKLWDEGTLCITIAANIAETAILRKKMCFPDSVVGFIPYEGESNTYFVHYLFTFIRQRIQNSIQGSIQDNINIDYLEKLELRIPDLPTQQKIAAVLSAFDDKIELNNKINAELESMAKTLYDYWFVQFEFPVASRASATASDPEALEGYDAGLRVPQPPREPQPPRVPQASQEPQLPRGYKSSGGAMEYNSILKREIPKGWEVSVFNDWIKQTKTGDWGKDEIEGNYTERVFCVRGADINGLNGKGEVKAPERFILKNNLSKKLEPNDFIIEISGGSPTQSTARITLLTKESFDRFDTDVMCSNFCKAVTLKDEIYAFNFQQEWQRLYDAGVFFGFEGKTSGIKNFLFDSFMESYHIVKPPQDLAKKYNLFAADLERKRQLNLIQNQELVQLRDWLLPMLMNGQVKVSDAEEMVYESLNMVAEDSVSYKRK